VNTSLGRIPTEDACHIRRSAIACSIPYATTVSASKASVEAIRSLQEGAFRIASLQDHHG